MSDNLTPDEIAAMHDANENFVGSVANFEKIRLFNEIKYRLAEFNQKVDSAVAGYYEPNPHKRNAILWLTLPPGVFLNSEPTAILADVIAKVDHLSIVSSEGRIELVFGLKDIWKK